MQGQHHASSLHYFSMSPAAPPSTTKAGQPQRTSSSDSTSDAIRKRVCKACDRCRLKKSKCDGSHPCSRCKADNAICVFGERKKSHDKVYPKGYVEMLEQQQGQLVAGLQEMYKRLLTAHAWEGPVLCESNGHPLTHDILAAIDLLELKQDGSGELETFEEDCQRLQSKLLAEGAGFAHRRGSISSESDHSSHDHVRSGSHGTPVLSKPTVFKDNFNFSSAPPSPLAQSPVARSRPSYPAPQPSPLQQSSPLTGDPQFYQAVWAYPDMSNPDVFMRSKYGMQAAELDNQMEHMTSMPWDGNQFDLNMASLTSYPQQLSNAFGNPTRGHEGGGGGGGASLDPMDADFNSFIQVVT